jgi:hypothetical protein
VFIYNFLGASFSREKNDTFWTHSGLRNPRFLRARVTLAIQMACCIRNMSEYTNGIY